MDSPRLIKKYANRRLYDTVDSRHVTLADLRRMIVGGTDIKVVDETSGEDITRALLLQIIVDREQAGQPLLTEMLLAQLIRFYGNPMQGMMADYLQRSVDTFLDQQRSVQSRLQSALSTTPVDTLRELMRGNALMWETLMGHAADDSSGESASRAVAATESGGQAKGQAGGAGKAPDEDATEVAEVGARGARSRRAPPTGEDEPG